MVVFDTSAAYIEQSSLLISARPTTTRITTHYSLPRPRPSKARKAKTTEDSTPAVAAPPSAILTLKTYDPVSGVVLKYRTNRAAEVGRLMASLGRLGGVMAQGRDVLDKSEGLQEMDVDQVDAMTASVPVAVSGTSGTSTPGGAIGSGTPSGTAGTTGGQKGKGKKKKGGK